MAFNVSHPTQVGAIGKTLDEDLKQGSTTPPRNVPWTGAGDDPIVVLPGDTARDLPSISGTATRIETPESGHGGAGKPDPYRSREACRDHPISGRQRKATLWVA